MRARHLLATSPIFWSVVLCIQSPKLTVFTAPTPFNVSPGDPQYRAFVFLTKLRPTPRIVIFGEEVIFSPVASAYPKIVEIDDKFDKNFRGTPLFNSLLQKALATSTSKYSMFINSDIILLNDVYSAIRRCDERFDNWLLTAVRWDARDWSFDDHEDQRGIANFVRENATLHTYGGADLWIWNTNRSLPLISAVMPPFAFARGKYDNWFLHEAVASELRDVVDASGAITNVHVQHRYEHATGNSLLNNVTSIWSTTKRQSPELFINIHLAESHGSYTNQLGTVYEAPWRLSPCEEPGVRGVCLLRRSRPSRICPCEMSAYAKHTQTDPVLVNDKLWTCGRKSTDRKSDYEIPVQDSKLAYSLDDLLPTVAINGSLIVLVVASYNYIDFLMNWVCRANRVGLPSSNILVGAIDDDLYRFAYTQGLAVFRYSGESGAINETQGSCDFGSQCFRQLTKTKSRLALTMLERGYSVLLSDIDIVLFRNPLSYLMSFGEGIFAVQGNRPNLEEAPNNIRRFNSGFYLARSDVKTLAAFRAITDHASQSRLSEQPSFYDILCGIKGERRQGIDACVWDNGLVVQVLDDALFPNGAVHGFWESENVTAKAEAAGIFLLHTNWVQGKENKLERLVANGLFHWNSRLRVCV